MNTPSRKTITAIIFFGFLIVFIVGLALYFGQAILSTTNTADTDTSAENRGFTFFPFGRGSGNSETPFVSVDPTEPTDPTNIDNQPGEAPILIDRLRQISDTPAAGGFVYARTKEGDSLFSSAPESEDVMRYVEASTGHIYEGLGDTETITRVTNTTIPRITNAVFLNGDQAILQYKDNATERKKTFSASVVEPIDNGNDEDVASARLSGIFLQDSIRDVLVQGADVIYTFVENGRFSIRKTDLNGNDIEEVFASELLQWHVKPFGINDLAVTHVPSFGSFGYAQAVDTDSKNVSKIFSGQLALQVLPSPNGERTMISFWDGSDMSLYVEEDATVRDTGLDTFAEKCVWSSDNIFVYCAEPLNDIEFGAPDDWYKGLESYSDDYYQVNTNTAEASLLFSPFEEGNYSLDVTNPALSSNEKFLSFIDKNTQTFWTYQLEL